MTWLAARSGAERHKFFRTLYVVSEILLMSVEVGSQLHALTFTERYSYFSDYHPCFKDNWPVECHVREHIECKQSDLAQAMDTKKLLNGKDLATVLYDNNLITSPCKLFLDNCESLSQKNNELLELLKNGSNKLLNVVVSYFKMTNQSIVLRPLDSLLKEHILRYWKRLCNKMYIDKRVDFDEECKDKEIDFDEECKDKEIEVEPPGHEHTTSMNLLSFLRHSKILSQVQMKQVQRATTRKKKNEVLLSMMMDADSQFHQTMINYFLKSEQWIVADILTQKLYLGKFIVFIICSTSQRLLFVKVFLRTFFLISYSTAFIK